MNFLALSLQLILSWQGRKLNEPVCIHYIVQLSLKTAMFVHCLSASSAFKTYKAIHTYIFIFVFTRICTCHKIWLQLRRTFKNKQQHFSNVWFSIPFLNYPYNLQQCFNKSLCTYIHTYMQNFLTNFQWQCHHSSPKYSEFNAF